MNETAESRAWREWHEAVGRINRRYYRAVADTPGDYAAHDRAYGERREALSEATRILGDVLDAELDAEQGTAADGPA